MNTVTPAYTLTVFDVYGDYLDDIFLPDGYTKEAFRPAKKNEYYLNYNKSVRTVEMALSDFKMPVIILKKKVADPITVVRTLAYTGTEQWINKTLESSICQPDKPWVAGVGEIREVNRVTIHSVEKIK